VKTVSIIGDGDITARLQELLSKADFKVVISDLNQDYAEHAADAHLVLEAGADDFASKEKVFMACDAKCGKETILATITATPWVTQIARATKRPEKVVGLNFTQNPFEDKYLCQVLKGLQTSENTVQAVKWFLNEIGITAVELEENPGFILDRVVASIVNEAAVMYMEKLATVEDIDKMMKACVNWPMGPFEFADNVGVDRVVEILESLSQQLGPRYQPCFLLRKMVDAGWLGKKTGRGFYAYS